MPPYFSSLTALRIPTSQAGIAPIQDHHGLGVALVAEGGGGRVVGLGGALLGCVGFGLFAGFVFGALFFEH